MSIFNEIDKTIDTFFGQCDDMFDEELREQGKEALMELGLPEDEAERELEDLIK